MIHRVDAVSLNVPYTKDKELTKSKKVSGERSRQLYKRKRHLASRVWLGVDIS